jgi:predicted DNA-binding ribbon-helix-helix protein
MPGQDMHQDPPAKKNGRLQKRSMRIAGLRTSLALEEEFWEKLEAAARAKSMTLPVLVAAIDLKREQEYGNTRSLASAVRVFIIEN